MTSHAATLAVISPGSVQIWYDAFAGDNDPSLFIGEKCHPVDVVKAITQHPDKANTRLFSSHASLRRDRAVAQTLMDLGLRVSVQSALAVNAGTDRVWARERLAARQVPQPTWGVGPSTMAGAGGQVLVKGRGSTQSQAIRWATQPSDVDASDYWECYIGGVEFSVVLFREHGQTTILPIVYKGPAQRDLLPPWRRLRLCPPPAAYDYVVETLSMLGRTVAEALDIWGFAEAEFVVTPDGEAYLLEVNPRISGTLRVAAMAASAPIFDHQRFPGGRDWPASGYACEAPYDGAPFVTANVIATSRITCRADDPDHSRAILDRHVVGLRWPAKLQ